MFITLPDNKVVREDRSFVDSVLAVRMKSNARNGGVHVKKRKLLFLGN